ncbi:MAG TPA: VOC family protein [Burkholderiaceae bacterium]|nr:VOC family protein [Burkholderiaceae bacterium]
MRILGLDHIVLRCNDLAAMLRFYRDTLGCHVEKHNEKLGLIHLRAGSALVDLISVEGELGRVGGAGPGAQARNVDHFCLRIDPFDEQSLRDRFRAQGVELSRLHDNYGSEGTGPSLYLTDPEGNSIELKGPSHTPAVRRKD